MNIQGVAGLMGVRRLGSFTTGGYPLKTRESQVISFYRMQPGPDAISIACHEPESLAACAVKTNNPAEAHKSAHCRRSGPCLCMSDLIARTGLKVQELVG